MKVGDQKQAAILGIVAVGAVVFLFMQLKGKSGPSTVVAAVNGAPAVETVSPAHSKLPHSLYGDPFSHPILGQLASEVKEAPQAAEPDPSQGDTVPALPDGTGRMGLSGMIGSFMRPSWTPHTRPKVGKTTPPVKAEAIKMPSLTLSAVVSAGTPMALISIEGGSASRFSQGQRVAAGISIQAILEDRITLSVSGHKGPVTLLVGAKFQP